MTFSFGTGASTYANSTGTVRMWGPPPRLDDPILRQRGPVVCSSSTELSVLPGTIWDVNGYYRELGVPHDATRRQLMKAYQAKDGQSSRRLTYIFKQLLDPEIRFAYDCTPLGEMFMDRYVHEWLKRKIIDEKSRRMQHLHDAGIDLSRIDPDAVERDVAASMGFMAEPSEEDGDTPSETVDETSPNGQDDLDRPPQFWYSYYRWKAKAGETDQLLGVLSEWQRLLVSELAHEGIKIAFAVGIHGKGPHRWLSAKVGYRTVIYLNEEVAPTRELASTAARALAADLRQAQ